MSTGVRVVLHPSRHLRIKRTQSNYSRPSGLLARTLLTFQTALQIRFIAVTAALVTLAALSGLQGVSACDSDPKCKDGTKLYCCMYRYQIVVTRE